MLNPFRDYAFQEVVESPDKGANWLLLGSFDFTAQELSDWEKHVQPQKNPSIHSELPHPQLRLIDTAGIKDIATDLDKKTHHIPRNLYAIYATAAYMATTFDHVVMIRVQTEGKEDRSGSIDAASFLRNFSDIKKEALTFYVSMLEMVGVHKPTRNNLQKKVAVKMIACPKDGHAHLFLK
jgi:hypothetical protein